jgi:hypothetical protein
VERNPFLPTGIGELGLFTDNPIRTRALAVEQRKGQLTLIPTSPRGAPATERTTEKRAARYFEVPRLRHGDTIYADEIQSVRAFGQETEVMQLQTEVERRLAGPTGLQSNMEFTFEHMRLAAIQGLLIDADGSTAVRSVRRVRHHRGARDRLRSEPRIAGRCRAPHPVKQGGPRDGARLAGRVHHADGGDGDVRRRLLGCAGPTPT